LKSAETTALAGLSVAGAGLALVACFAFRPTGNIGVSALIAVATVASSRRLLRKAKRARLAYAVVRGDDLGLVFPHITI
jgi:hypothetical protein